MEQLNYESYYYSLNIAGYKEWSNEALLNNIESARNAMDRIMKDVYDEERIKRVLPPMYVVDGYKWAKHVVSVFEQELKERGVIEKDELDLLLEKWLD